VATLVILVLAGSSSAATYYVRQNGNDSADGDKPEVAFKTIVRAAQALDHGDDLVIGPGSYQETVLLADRFSADGSVMKITGDETGKATGDPAGPIIIQANSPTAPAMHVRRFRHVNISGLTFRGTGQGLKLERCLDATVERCTFDGLSRGLAGIGDEDLRVQSSVFAHCTIGVFVQSSVNTRVAYVTLAGSTSVGLLALSCGKGEVRNSILAGNNSNMIADLVSAPAWLSDHNVIAGTNGPWGAIPAVANVYEWPVASGQDRHSVYVVPAFADAGKYDLHISPTVTWPGGLPGGAIGDTGKAGNAELETGVLDRDGKPFRSGGGAAGAGAYDYPDPQPAAGWNALQVKITGAGPRQSAGVYGEDGTLIRTLLADAAGVRELYWDGLDDLGHPAAAGKYRVKTISHDVRIADDGAMGDNGNPMGAYNCDNADHVVALSDGGFIVSTLYDEAGFALRRYSSSGQPIFASNLAEKDIVALAPAGEDIFVVAGKGAAGKLQRLVLPGDRAKMASGSEDYPLFTAEEKSAETAGIAIVGKLAFISVRGLNVVRVIDLTTGKKNADWPMPAIGDIAADNHDKLWVISGKDLCSLNADGKIEQRLGTGLDAPQSLAVAADRFAVVDRKAGKVAILDGAGKAIRTFGTPRTVGAWTPVSLEALLDPRGCTFLPNGNLILTEHNRVRIIIPETGKIVADIISNFMDTAVVHPTQSEFVYCSPGIFRVDPKTGAWRWLVESPQGMKLPPDKEGKEATYSYGSPSLGVVLGGKPFIAFFANGQLRMFEVSDPLKPRLSLEVLDKGGILGAWAYATISITKDGSIVAGGNYSLSFNVIPFKGLDGGGNPIYDFAATAKVGPEKDPLPRGMKCINAPSADRVTGDIYYLAVTDLYNKMVPAWGADGTGVGRSTPDGKPLWFALSSGGNYQAGCVVNDGKKAWYLAGKSFGGQLDLFDGDGLRLTTGNWSWPCNYGIGFVDLRYGVHGYMRPDGKVGAYVEDDAIGRFARCRIEGAETITRATTDIDWRPAQPTAAAEPPDAQKVRGKGAGGSLGKVQVIPRVAEMKMDGDWSAWEKAGVVPQIVSLPAVGYHRNFPEDAWQTFRDGTSIGAIAHDGSNLYVYFVCAKDTMHFDAEQPGSMWMFDSVELWIEEEQFGLGFTKDGTQRLFKFRYHNREGKEWAAGYGLPPDNVWAAKIDDLSAHPLGRQLAAVTGVSFGGKHGYAVMGKIPMAEVKLVGGIAGRGGKDILNMTGNPGEILRIGVNFGGICAWGREQDYKVPWPSGLMFSDPTRSAPFVLGK
jgi:hypothetical protein